MSDFNVNNSKFSYNSGKRGRENGLLMKVSAPGKVILYGEHSVVYGKLAVAASLGLRTKLTLTELKNHEPELNAITVQLKDLNLVQSYDLMLIKQKLINKNRWEDSNCVLEKPELVDHDKLLLVAEDFVKNFTGPLPLNSYQTLALSSLFYLFTGILGSVDFELKPLIVNLETDLTISAGTGSSASYLVTLAAAFIQYVKLKLNRVQKNGSCCKEYEIKSCLKLNNDELQLISNWAQNAERIIHGPASGIDNTICTFGSMVEFRKGSSPKVIDLPCKFRLLLVNSLVPRDTKSLVARVAENKKEFPVIIEHVLESMDALTQSALDTIIEISQLNKTIKNEENNEINLLYRKLGKLTDMNQNLLATLGVSHPRLNKICAILKSGSLNGKLTGAGGGGYAMSLIPPYYSDNEIKNIVGRLEMEGFRAQVTDLGGPGVLIDEFKIDF